MTAAAMNMADIKEAIKERLPKTEKELENILLSEIHDFIPLFLAQEADKLLPFCLEIDTQIEICCKANRTLEALPWGPVYNMSKEELLVL